MSADATLRMADAARDGSPPRPEASRPLNAMGDDEFIRSIDRFSVRMFLALRFVCQVEWALSWRVNEAAGYSHPHASVPIARRLEELGLVTRTRSNAWRHAVQVRVTREGRRFCKRLQEVMVYGIDGNAGGGRG